MSKARQIIIYGASGHSGSLIAQTLARQGLQPILAGRDQHRVRLLADRLQLPWTCFNIEDDEAAASVLANCNIMLNTAGPFSTTARRLAKLCIASQTHYLDISGELKSTEQLRQLHTEAKEGNVMLLPCVGYEVTVADSLCALLRAQATDIHSLDIALQVPTRLSPGSAMSLFEEAGEDIWLRRNHQLARAPYGEVERLFDFKGTARRCPAVSWADIVTAYVSTGVPNITAYLDVTAMLRLSKSASEVLRTLAQVPGGVEIVKRGTKSLGNSMMRARQPFGKSTCIVEACSTEGRVRRKVAVTEEPYAFTARSAAMAVTLVAKGRVLRGFHSPSRVFGTTFLKDIGGVRIYG